MSRKHRRAAKGDYRFGPLTLHSEAGWTDTTEALDDEFAPVTLTKEDGVGSLQFSVAEYKRGPRPLPTEPDLAEMLREFARGRGLGRPTTRVKTHSGPPLRAEASFHWNENFVRVWYLSGKGHFVLITYVCEWPDRNVELDEAERIVSSVTFQSKS